MAGFKGVPEGYELSTRETDKSIAQKHARHLRSLLNAYVRVVNVDDPIWKYAVVYKMKTSSDKSIFRKGSQKTTKTHRR